MQFTYKEKKISSGLLIDLWLNAVYFHNNSDKIKELDEINNVVGEKASKQLMLIGAFTSVSKMHIFYRLITEMR